MRIPNNYTEFEEGVMSNCDHVIEHEVADKIKNKRLWAAYPGWNFYGKVWFRAKKWNCEVWSYGSYNSTYSADTLEEIMSDVSMDYGYE